MNDFLQEIEQEIENLERQFQNNLNATGNTELARDYSDIITVRQSLEVFRRKASKQTAHVKPVTFYGGGDTLPVKQNGIRFVERSGNKSNGFILSKAVKDIAKSYGADDQFSINDLWVKLREIYPNDIQSDEKKRSASATLSNLTKAGEIIRVKKGEGGDPTIYKVAPQGKTVEIRN